MKKFSISLIFILNILFIPHSLRIIYAADLSNKTISLAGQWKFRLDPEKKGLDEKWFQSELTDTVTLPGTTDENKKGFLNQEHTTSCLNRIYTYEGPAWYQRQVEIPQSWEAKHITISLERTKLTKIWLDNNYIGSQTTLSTPHIYDLSAFASPGKHTLTIMVDNTRDLFPVHFSHALSERTQTNWNGIIGKILLIARDPLWLEDVQIYPDIKTKTASLSLTIENKTSKTLSAEIRLLAASAVSDDTAQPAPLAKKTAIQPGENKISVTYPMPKDCRLWDEFSPSLYSMNITIITESNSQTLTDTAIIPFAMRQFSTIGTNFAVNGQKTFLRGKHDGCIFPLTGYPPTSPEQWEHVFNVAKSFGVNFYRFHSWCPPEAAFIAADKLGMYLQPELPNWAVMKDKEQFDFMTREGEQILKHYGGHPSFVMLSLGNELDGDFNSINKMVDYFRSIDHRHIYAPGSNNSWADPAAGKYGDFWTTSSTYRQGGKVVVDIDLVRGSMVHDYLGRINNEYPPSTITDYSREIACSNVPVISHELGQYLMFPDFNEIKKYTGVLRPYALEIFRDRLKNNNMLDQAWDFFRASGILAAICYREDIETVLRTPGFGGLVIYDLQDYPGQGTAFLGMADSFMDPKGIIAPKKWRQFCSETVPLLLIPKRTWTNDQTITAGIKIAHFGPKDIKNAKVTCSLYDSANNRLLETTLTDINIPSGGLADLGTVTLPLKNITAPQKAVIKLQIAQTNFRNDYDIWIYPAQLRYPVPRNIILTRDLDENTSKSLLNGAKVLLLPELHDLRQSIKGQFITNFWTVPYFKHMSPPGTLGILCDPNHPLFKNFPTEFHSNWQWWPLTKYARPVILDQTPPQFRPLVQVIDNYETSRKLGLIFEAKIGKGKLLFCSADLLNNKDKPEVRQLFYSIIAYVGSDSFDPKVQLDINTIKSLFESPCPENQLPKGQDQKDLPPQNIIQID